MIVVGGGTAGLAAAIAAGRNGANTLLIERYGFLGGTMTAGLVNPFMTFTHGIFKEIVDHLEIMNGYCERSRPSEEKKSRSFDSEIMKIVADEIVKEAGAKLLLHTCAIDVAIERDSIRGVEVHNKSGKQVILGKIVVDATGDGDIAVMAGAPYEKGRKEDGLSQPMTLNFRMGGVDEDIMPSRQEITRLFIEAKSKGDIRNPREDVLFFPAIRRGEMHFNTTRIVKVDGTDAEDLTYAEIEGRRQVAEMVKFLKNNVPGFEKAYLLMSGVQIGIRETRRIIGEYVLTGEDILKAREFDDAIANGAYPIDIHSPTGEGTFIKGPPPGELYDIPYRCLVPRKIENLLVAGRCISTTHEAQAAIRVIPIVLAIGQAAGTAAALSARLGTTPRKLDVSLLQKTLREQEAVPEQRYIRSKDFDD